MGCFEHETDLDNASTCPVPEGIADALAGAGLLALPAPEARLGEVAGALAQIVGDAYAAPHDTKEWQRLAVALTASASPPGPHLPAGKGLRMPPSDPNQEEPRSSPHIPTTAEVCDGYAASADSFTAGV